MNFRFCLGLIFCFSVIHFIEGKAKEKPSNEKDTGKAQTAQTGAQQSEEKPKYINQFSQSLRFLGSFFQIIQRQLNDTIVNFNPNRPNPLFSVLLSNPNLIPFALRRLREPLNEMMTITNRIEQIVSSTDSTKLEDSKELNKLLQQLQRRLQTLFGPLMPHNGLSTRIPTSFPAALESFSNWVSQMASMLAIFSQSVRDVTSPNSNPNDDINPMSLFNKSDTSEVDSICSQLHSLSLFSNEFNSMNLTERQNGVPDLIDTSVSALTNVLGYVGSNVGALFHSFGGAVDSYETGVIGKSTLENNGMLIPLKLRNVDDLQQLTFGVISPQNKLVIVNILTRDQVQYKGSAANQTDLLSRLSLTSLQSLMTTLVNDIQDISEPRVLSALECQLKGFDCSIRNRDNYSEVQTCLTTLSTCFGTIV